MAEAEGFKDRMTSKGEDALGKLAQDLLENPLISSALSRAFDARERAVQAQEAAMGALNLPSAADIERLTRRLRAVSQRLEGIEDGVEKLDGRFAGLTDVASSGLRLDERLAAIEGQLTKLAVDVGRLAEQVDPTPAPVHRQQESLPVPAEPAADPPAKPAREPA